MANTYTPKLALRQPAQGDDLWDDDLNLNSAIIEFSLMSFLMRGGVIWGSAPTDLGGLSVRVAACAVRVAGTLFNVAQVDKACTDDAANLIYVDSAGAVQVATTLPSGNYAALALVETAAGDIVRIMDLRCKIVDVLAEHDLYGQHTVINPSHVYPTTGGTGGYHRSMAASYQDPEYRVNNLVLKNDVTPLVSLTGKSNGFTQEFTASALGSGYVPACANGLVVSARAYDVSGDGHLWKLYPSDAAADDDVRFAAVVGYSGGVMHEYEQLMFRLSPLGKFIVECWCEVGSTTDAQLVVRLVGWIEPA